MRKQIGIVSVIALVLSGLGIWVNCSGTRRIIEHRMRAEENKYHERLMKDYPSGYQLFTIDKEHQRIVPGIPHFREDLIEIPYADATVNYDGDFMHIALPYLRYYPKDTRLVNCTIGVPRKVGKPFSGWAFADTLLVTELLKETKGESICVLGLKPIAQNE